MPTLPVTLTGTLVSVVPARAYSFTPEGETAKREGFTRLAYIVCDFEDGPVKLKFTEADAMEHGRLADAGMGAVVTVTGDVVDGPAVRVSRVRDLVAG
jgi:hypothetical protein